MGRWFPLPGTPEGGGGPTLYAETLAAWNQSTLNTWQNWGSAIVIPNPGAAVHLLSNIIAVGGTAAATVTHAWCRIYVSSDGGATFTEYNTSGNSLWHDARGQYANFSHTLDIEVTPTADIHVQAQVRTGGTTVSWSGGLGGLAARLTANVWLV